MSENKKMDLETNNLLQNLENQADAFSQNTLIPKEEYDLFIVRYKNSINADIIKNLLQK